MPLFAFLKQFSKIDDENSAKRVFRHVEHLRLLHMPLFAFLKHFSKIDYENSAENAFFGLLNICDYCVCLYLRFYSSFQKLMMKTVQKRVFQHVEHLRILHIPIFAFLEKISKIDDENSSKRVFSPC